MSSYPPSGSSASVSEVAFPAAFEILSERIFSATFASASSTLFSPETPHNGYVSEEAVEDREHERLARFQGCGGGGREALMGGLRVKEGAVEEMETRKTCACCYGGGEEKDLRDDVGCGCLEMMSVMSAKKRRDDKERRGVSLFECHDGCICSDPILLTKCLNRVTQGIEQREAGKVDVEVFHTGGKRLGWGLRAKTFIPRGRFVVEYLGEVITSEEARQLRKVRKRETQSPVKNYLLTVREWLQSVDRDDSEPKQIAEVMNELNIDATEVGNCARFINHSCSPTLELLLVRRDYVMIPHACFFTVRDVLPYEELTFDYGYQDGSPSMADSQRNRVSCLCGSTDCRGYLPFDATAP